jgi:O-antigen/teichoic acid export membrane protein
VLNLLLVIVVTHGLVKGAAGAVFIVTSVYFVVETVVRLGTDIGIVHFVASRRARDSGGVTDVIWASFVPLIPAMLVGAVIVGVLTPVVIHSLASHGGVDHVWLVGVLIGLAVPVGATYDFMTATTRGLGATRPTVLVERILRPVLQTIGVVAAVAVNANGSVVIVAWIVPYFVTLPIMTLWLRTLLHARQAPLRAKHWRSVFAEVWRFTLPRSMTGILQILLQRLDIVIVGAILGGPAAAIYTGATRFVVVGQLGNQAISYVFQPQLAGLLGRGKVEEARDLFRVSTAWIVGLNAPLYLTVCVTAPLLVKLLGRHYQAGISSMIIVTAASLVGSSCGLVDFVLVTMGRTSWNLMNATAALAINLAIDLIFISHIGIVAAAIGWAVAILTNNFLPLTQVYRTFNFSPVSPLWWRMIGLNAVLYGVLPGTTLLIFGSDLPVMVGVLAVVTVVYLGMIWRWRERLALNQLLSGDRKYGAVARARKAATTAGSLPNE